MPTIGWYEIKYDTSFSEIDPYWLEKPLRVLEIETVPIIFFEFQM